MQKISARTLILLVVGLTLGACLKGPDGVESELELRGRTEALPRLTFPILPAPLPGVGIDLGRTNRLLRIPQIESFDMWRPEPREVRIGDRASVANIPVTLTDTCVGPPQEQRWQLRYTVRPQRYGITRIRICEALDGSRRCFYDRSAPTGAPWMDGRSDSEITPPPLPPIHPESDRLLDLQYELTVWGTEGMSTSRTLERRLAPFPQVSFTAPTVVHGPDEGGAPFTFSLPYRARNVVELQPLLSYTTPASSPIQVSFPEDRDTIARYGARVEAKTVAPTEHADTLCFTEVIDAHDWQGFRRAGMPVALLASAPRIEECQLSVVTSPRATIDARLYDLSHYQKARVPPPFMGCRSGAAGGRVGGSVVIGPGGASSGSGSACVAGTACDYRPPECNGPSASFSVTGRIACVRGEPVCRGENGRDYCSSSGGLCGNSWGQGCYRDADCAPGLVCGSDYTYCDPRGGEPCGVCRTIETWPGNPCPHKPNYCWMPRAREDAIESPWNNVDICLNAGDVCERSCPGECGHDGCGGSCGECDEGDACAPLSGEAHSGQCVPDECATDADCCTDSDPDVCGPLGRRRCWSGHCTGTF